MTGNLSQMTCFERQRPLNTMSDGKSFAQLEPATLELLLKRGRSTIYKDPNTVQLAYVISNHIEMF